MTDFLLPDLGEGLQEAEIVTWKVAVGDTVREGDDMVEMSTAKAVVEVPSPFSGTVTKLHGGPGDIINTGGVLISFALEGEAPEEPVAKSEKSAPEQSKKKEAASKQDQSASTGGSGEQVFKLPDLGEGLPDAEIVKWCVAVGDDLVAGEPMVEMSTAKAVVEVPAPFSGKVIKLFGAVGDVIETGAPLISAAGEGADVSVSHAELEPTKTQAGDDEKQSGDAGTVVGAVQVGTEVKSESSQSADGIKAGPAVRAIARKLKVDMKRVKGTGAGGEITMSDVRAFAESGGVQPSLPASSSHTTVKNEDGAIKAGPVARSLAESLGINLGQVSGTGDKGTITKQDVLAAARSLMTADGHAAPISSARSSVPINIADARSVLAAPKVRAFARDNGIDLRHVSGTGPKGSISLADANAALKADFAAPQAVSGHYQRPMRAYDVSGEPQKLVGPRRVMAQAMAKSNTEVCHTSIFDEADIAAWPAKTDITVRIMRAIIAAAMVEPAINAHFNGETFEKTIRPDINLGVGVDSDKGLFVPVIRNAETLDGKALRETLNRHRQAIADNKITPQDMAGATITLSNFGMIAGKFATPIVSIPQVAIVGIGGLYEKLVMTEKGIVNHRFMPISLTFDHRACTGGEAARYLGAMIADLQLSY